MKKSMVHKLFITTGIIATLMFTSACSGDSGATPQGSPSTTATATASTEATATAPATPEPTQTATTPTGSIPTKDEVVSNGRGEYLQTTINDDDPAMKYDDSIVDEAARANFTQEEILAAQQAAVRFTAEETFDSTANGGTDADKEAWWKANEYRFHPLQKDVIHQNFMSDAEGQALVLIGRWRDGYDFNYDAGKARIVKRSLKPTYIKGLTSPDGTTPYLGINIDATVESSFKLKDDTTQNEASTGYASYSMLKDTDGEWKIVGYKNQFTTIPLQ